MPFYMGFDLFLALDLKITLWLSEILNNHSEVSIYAVFEADTSNKMDSSTWKGMKMVTKGCEHFCMRSILAMERCEHGWI